MTFEEWVAKQPNRVRRDLHERPWIRGLCREAYEAGVKHGEESYEDREQERTHFGTGDEDGN